LIGQRGIGRVSSACLEAESVRLKAIIHPLGIMQSLGIYGSPLCMPISCILNTGRYILSSGLRHDLMALAKCAQFTSSRTLQILRLLHLLTLVN
jgi:hypothetical protein